jgi:drug/metabolite transporter (DMT)-like permease
MLSGSLAFAVMSALAHAAKAGGCPWPLVALARSGLALVFAVLLARLGRARLHWWRPGRLWVRSLAGSCALVTSFYAVTHAPPPTVLTLTNTFPLWIAVLAWPLYGHRPTAGVWLAVVTGLAGVVLIQRPDLAEGADAATRAALVSSVFSAVALLGLHELQDLDARAVVAHFSGVSVLFCLATLAWVGAVAEPVDKPFPTEAVLGLLLAVGMLATAGQLCLTKAFATGPPSQVAVVGLTQILFVQVIDLLWWARWPDAPTLIGMALIVIPSGWVMSRGRRP